MVETVPKAKLPDVDQSWTLQADLPRNSRSQACYVKSSTSSIYKTYKTILLGCLWTDYEALLWVLDGLGICVSLLICILHSTLRDSSPAKFKEIKGTVL